MSRLIWTDEKYIEEVKRCADVINGGIHIPSVGDMRKNGFEYLANCVESKRSIAWLSDKIGIPSKSAYKAKNKKFYEIRAKLNDDEKEKFKLISEKLDPEMMMDNSKVIREMINRFYEVIK